MEVLVHGAKGCGLFLVPDMENRVGETRIDSGGKDSARRCVTWLAIRRRTISHGNTGPARPVTPPPIFIFGSCFAKTLGALRSGKLARPTLLEPGVSGRSIQTRPIAL